MELQEKKQNDEQDIGTLIRKSPKKKGAYQLQMQNHLN